MTGLQQLPSGELSSFYQSFTVAKCVNRLREEADRAGVRIVGEDHYTQENNPEAVGLFEKFTFRMWTCAFGFYKARNPYATFCGELLSEKGGTALHGKFLSFPSPQTVLMISLLLGIAMAISLRGLVLIFGLVLSLSVLTASHFRMWALRQKHQGAIAECLRNVSNTTPA